MKKSKTKIGLSFILALITVFSIVLPINAASQAPSIIWQKTYGASSADSMVQTSDGGYAIAATIIGGANGGHNEIIKTDKDGTLSWNTTIADSPISEMWIVASSDGGFAVARRSDNSSLVGSIIKVDSEGKVQWNQTYLQMGNSTFIDYAIHTKDDGFALIGQMQQGTWVIKTDSNGNVQWEKTYENFNGTLIAQTANGNFIYAGDSGGDDPTQFLCDLAIADKLGNIQTTKVYENQPGFRPRCLIVTSDEGFMITGSRFPNNTTVSAFTLKTDSNGNLIWDTTYGENTGFRVVAENKEGGYIFAGGIYTSEPQYSARLIKTDSLGATIWEAIYKGQGNAYVYSIYQTGNDSYVFAGATGKVNSSTTEMWLVKVAQTQNETLNSTLTIIVSAVAAIAIAALIIIVYRMRKSNRPA